MRGIGGIKHYIFNNMKKTQSLVIAAFIIMAAAVIMLSSCNGKSLTQSSHYSKCAKNGQDGCAWHNN